MLLCSQNKGINEYQFNQIRIGAFCPGFHMYHTDVVAVNLNEHVTWAMKPSTSAFKLFHCRVLMRTVHQVFKLLKTFPSPCFSPKNVFCRKCVECRIGLGLNH